MSAIWDDDIHDGADVEGEITMPNKSTPGPWFVVAETLGNVESESGVQVAQAQQVGTDDRHTEHAERMANAHLIAAAPELRAALISLLNEVESQSRQHNDSFEAAITQAQRVIAKTEGRL